MHQGNTIIPAFESPFAAVGSLLAFLGLALPFIPLPGDQATRIAVEFRTAEMAAPRSFTARTTGNICYALAAAMAYDDPANGRFTRIDCGRGEAPDLVLGAK